MGGPVVLGSDLWSKGCGFESQLRIQNNAIDINFWGNMILFRTVVKAQLVEWLLPTPEIPGSNPDIDEFYYQVVKVHQMIQLIFQPENGRKRFGATESDLQGKARVHLYRVPHDWQEDLRRQADHLLRGRRGKSLSGGPHPLEAAARQHREIRLLVVVC